MPSSGLKIGWSLFLWLALACAPSGASASGMSTDPQQQWQFAEHLLQQSRFRQAAEEFERFVFFFPEHPQRRNAALQAGRAFMLAGDGIAALQNLSPLTIDGPADDLAVDAYFLTAEAYLLLDNPSQAILLLQNLIDLKRDPAVRDSAYLRIGWIYVERMDWAAARKAWGRISPEGDQASRIDMLQTALDRSDRLPRKNPTLAGLLSIVPGAGQLYCGRYEDALAALVVNVGLFWAAYDSFDEGLNGLGGLLTVAGLGFYTANIYGAVSSAHKYNQNQNRDFVDQLKQNFSLRLEPTAPSGVSAALVLRWQVPF